MTSAHPPKPATHNGDLTKLPRALAHLRDQRVWVGWRWSLNGKKWTKPPYRVDNPDCHALNNDSTTWGTYEKAVAQVRAGKLDGIGIALKGLNIGGIDLDHCRDPKTGTIETWAQERIEQFPGAYLEVTVSGKGLRILGNSTLENFAPKHKQAGVELFSNSNHYLTLSCNQIGECSTLPDIADKMTALDAELSCKKNGNGFNFDAAPHVDDAPHVAPEEPEPQPKPENATPWTFAEETRLRSALAAIPIDEKQITAKLGHSHTVWVNIGRAIERLGWGDRGLLIWRDWSMQSPEYNERGLYASWASFARNRSAREKPITIATLYGYAIKSGWRGEEVAQEEEEKPLSLPWISISNWDNEPVPQQDWTVLNRIPQRQTALFSGERAAGKSLTTLYLAAAHALGRDWLGTMPAPGPAFFIDAEDDKNVLHIRLASILNHFGATFKEAADNGLHIMSLAGEDAVLATMGRDGKIEPTHRYKQLLEAAGDIKPKMIGIASAANVFAGDENSRTDVQQFVGLLTRLAMAADGSVTLISHPSLTGINTGSGISGTTQWHNAVRARFYLTSIKPESGEQPDNNLREIIFKKNQYGPVSENIVLRWRDGLFLPVPGMTSLDKAAAELAADQLFLKLLNQYTDRGRNLSDKISSNNYAPAEFAKEQEAKKASFRRNHLEAAMRRLFTASKIKVATFGPPSKLRSKLVVV